MFVVNGFIPTITKPTRVIINSATFIDHVFLKYNPQTSYIAGSIMTDISDHYDNVIFINETSIKSKYIHKRSKRRHLCKSNIYKNALSTSWEDLPVKLSALMGHTLYLLTNVIVCWVNTFLKK